MRKSQLWTKKRSGERYKPLGLASGLTQVLVEQQTNELTTTFLYANSRIQQQSITQLRLLPGRRLGSIR